MKCVLCGKEIKKKFTQNGTMYWDKGNNAEPLAHGRCCDHCNTTKVIPARMRL